MNDEEAMDFQAVRDMLKSHRNNGTKLRGCSTISQQVAKNVFTFGTRTIVRKIEEAYWTGLIEIIWGKRRILEVYLNVVEWGCGIYGAEAAAQEYFRSNASDLSPSRAAAMAVCLPLPLIESPDKLSPSYEKRCERIIKQLQNHNNVMRTDKLKVVNADGTIAIGGRLFQHGLESARTVNGEIRLYHAPTLEALPNATESLPFGHVFPITPQPFAAPAGTSRFFQLRVE